MARRPRASLEFGRWWSINSGALGERLAFPPIDANKYVAFCRERPTGVLDKCYHLAKIHSPSSLFQEPEWPPNI